jgi:hypothetical protein
MIEFRDGRVFHKGRLIGKIELNHRCNRWQFRSKHSGILLAESGTHHGVYRDIERRYDREAANSFHTTSPHSDQVSL